MNACENSFIGNGSIACKRLRDPVRTLLNDYANQETNVNLSGKQRPENIHSINMRTIQWKTTTTCVSFHIEIRILFYLMQTHSSLNDQLIGLQCNNLLAEYLLKAYYEKKSMRCAQFKSSGAVLPIDVRYF